MLKAISLATAAALLSATLAVAQGSAPTRTPVESTPEQAEAIKAGVELHDKEQYDDAIAKYQEVLKANADNIEAIYEMAYSYLEKKDYDRSIETARRGTQYKSELLPMFYEMIASTFEAKEQPQQAIATYRQAIAVEPGNALYYYDMAVAYKQALKDPMTARQTLKQAIATDPKFAPAPLLLAQWFDTEGYRTQAFLAASRAAILEPSVQSYALWRQVLKGPVNPMADGVMQDADMRAPVRTAKPVPPKTDEGDFAAVDALFGPAFQGMQEHMEDGTPEIEALSEQVGGLIDAIGKQPASKPPAFVSQVYVPFFVALKQKEYVQPFVYWASQRSRLPGVRDWMTSNEGRVREFLEWASHYQWPNPPAAPGKR